MVDECICSFTVPGLCVSLRYSIKTVQKSFYICSFTPYFQSSSKLYNQHLTAHFIPWSSKQTQPCWLSMISMRLPLIAWAGIHITHRYPTDQASHWVYLYGWVLVLWMANVTFFILVATILCKAQNDPHLMRSRKYNRERWDQQDRKAKQNGRARGGRV